MRVVLISLFDVDFGIGIKSISAYLKNHGYDVKLIQFGMPMFVDARYPQFLDYQFPALIPPLRRQELTELKSLVKNLEPSLIGFGVVSALHNVARRLTKELRTISSAPIIWGGIHPTIDPEKCLGDADIVCQGEGEAPMLDLVRRMEAGLEFSDIPNLWIRQNRRVIRNNPRTLQHDLNAFPINKINQNDRFFVPQTIPEEIKAMGEVKATIFRNYNIISSRGCPFSCTYCYNSFLRDFYPYAKPYRRRTVDHVIEEAQYARYDLNAKFIAFWDDIFCVDRDWVFDFVRKYKSKVGLPFFCYLHTQFVKEDLIDALVDAGLRMANIGVETGSERLRQKFYHRPEKNSDILRAATICNHRIAMYYDLLIDNPVETEDDLRETLELFLQFPRPFHIMAFALVFFPNYRLTRQVLSQGLISKRFIYSSRNLAKNFWKPDWKGMPPQINSLNSLIFATQHPEVGSEEIRCWARDKKELSNPRQLHARIYKKLMATKSEFQ